MAVTPWFCRAAQVRMPRRREAIRVENLDDEALLIDPETGNVMRLNQTARLVWEHCDAAGHTHDVAHELSRQYDVAPDTALSHVEELLALFADQGLLTP